MLDELLPIGSVVRLKNGSKRIMICGRLQERVEDGIVFDYCACFYPEGILDPEQLFLFNHKDIDDISYHGLDDQEEFAFRTFLMEHKRKHSA